ncbi:MAG TPA: AAA family ATPase [Hyalangium sp.]|jgi:predicted ATPase|nr:AAA family ATPase [Hyalangium sp.]
MQLLRLKIENLRSIQHLDLDLAMAPDSPRRRLVLLGANGAGKSTLLDAVAYVFQAVGSDTKDLGATELSAGDVRSVGEPRLEANAPPPRGLIELQAFLTPEERRGIVSYYPEAPHSGELRFTVGGGLLSRTMRSVGVFSIGETSFEDAAHAALVEAKPPCVLLPADRGVLEPREDLMLRDVTDFNPRQGALSRSRERFASLAARMALAYAGDKRLDQSQSVSRMWKVLEKYFPELPRPAGIEGLSIRFLTRDGASVGLGALSEGQRALLLVFGEIALRAPQHGVVLIDEVEQHLHPRWQRIIPEALTSLVPTAQFILTTQSPYLAASVPDDRLELGSWSDDGE